MAEVTSGVYPVFNIGFKINTAGRGGTTEDMVIIKDMESFSVAIDGKVEEWTPMDTEGWVRKLMTGKGLTISLKGKRNVGDPGNDYVAETAWKSGLDCSSEFEVDFPDGSKLAFDCVVDVKNPGGGDSTAVTELEADIIADGKPTYTPVTTP
jgi:hypothetical protein